MSEAVDIEKPCREMLEQAGYYVLPKQRTRCPHCHKPIGDELMVDIAACSPQGQFTAIECKDGKTGLNTKAKRERYFDQLRILDLIRGKRGRVAVVASREDAERLIGERKP